MSPSFLRGRKTAVCALVSLLAASLSQADTLASWDLSAALSSSESISATPSTGIASASLSRGSGAGAGASSTTGFGGKTFNDTSYADASSNLKYFDLAFTVASGYEVEPAAVGGKYQSTKTSGPTKIQWAYFVDSGEEMLLGNETSIDATGSAKNLSIDISSLGTIGAASTVTLRVYIWGAAKDTGTFFFKESLTLSGTATSVGGGPIPPSVSVEDFGTIYAGEESGVALTYAGDNVELSITADTEIAGTTNYVDGVFYFTPAVADIGEITFTATATDTTGVCDPDTKDFTATVVKKPDFLEGFETKAQSSYVTSLETLVVEDAATWRGTNFNVNTFTEGYGRGTRALKFKESGWIEMATDKANGAASVSFYCGFAKSAAKDAEGTIAVLISNNAGATWSEAGSPIQVTATLTQYTLNPGKGGNVRLKFVYTGNHDGKDTAAVVIDDIEITNYDGAAVVDPAIKDIGSVVCHADDATIELTIEYYGDSQGAVVKTVSTSAEGIEEGVDYTFAPETGVFTFTPSEEHLGINGGVIEFTAGMSVDGEPVAPRSFTVTVSPALAKYLRLKTDASESENFNSIGGAATAELPAPWRVAYVDDLEKFDGISYETAASACTQRAAYGSKSTAAGVYNVGAANEDEDRAVAFLSSGDHFRTCALIVPVKNVGRVAVSKFTVSYSLEKWRTGNAKKLDLCYSTGAPDWNWTKINTFHEETAADEGVAWYADAESQPAPILKRGEVGVNVGAGETIYLGWFYSANRDNSSSAQAWAVDDIRLRIGDDSTVIIMR